MKILHHKSWIVFEFVGGLKIPVSKLSFFDVALMELRSHKREELEKHLKFLSEDVEKDSGGYIEEKMQLIKAIKKVIKEKPIKVRKIHLKIKPQ